MAEPPVCMCLFLANDRNVKWPMFCTRPGREGEPAWVGQTERPVYGAALFLPTLWESTGMNTNNLYYDVHALLALLALLVLWRRLTFTLVLWSRSVSPRSWVQWRRMCQLHSSSWLVSRWYSCWVYRCVYEVIRGVVQYWAGSELRIQRGKKLGSVPFFCVKHNTG